MIERRKFIELTAAAAAGPLLRMGATRARAAASGKKLGFALCGLGELSAQQIAPALQKTLNCRLAGKHVFCEKPLEVSVERCRQMIDAVKAAGRMLGVAYRCRFDPNHLECIRIARTRELGALKVIDAYFGFTIEPGGWRLKRSLSGGGPLMDLGVYALEATRYLTGEEPAWVSGITTTGDAARFSEVEESVIWQARFPSGAVSYCGASYNTGLAAYFRVMAERGWFGLDPAFFYTGNHGMRSDGKPIAFAPIDQFAAEMDDFALCILDGKPTRVSGEEGLRDVRIMSAIYESARTGRPVALRSA